MRILNLSGKVSTEGYTRVYTITSFPDVVVVDEEISGESVREISENFVTVMLGGDGRVPPTVDYRFSSPEEINGFLKEYAKRSPRDRLVDLYDRTFGVRYPERVRYVAYYGYSRYLYNVLSTLINSPLKPWVGLHGPNGVGKTKLLKAILGERYRGAFHVTGPSMGFKVEDMEDARDVVVDVSRFQNEGDLLSVMNELHRRGHQAIFMLEGEEIPEILSTIPFFYLPPLSGRPPKERLLLFEHILRGIEQEKGCRDRVEMEEGFLDILHTYQWPNNLSELNNALRFTLSISRCVLRLKDLPYHIKARLGQGDTPPGWEEYR